MLDRLLLAALCLLHNLLATARYVFYSVEKLFFQAT